VTPEQAANIIRIVEYGWPQREMLPETAMLYLGALGDLDYGDAEQAIKNLLRVSEYRPTVAEIRREAAEIAGLLPPGLDEAMSQARRWASWREQAAFRNSGELSVQPSTHDVVVKVCRSLTLTPSDPTWSHVFRAAYREATETEVRSVLAAPHLRALGAGS